MGQETKLEQQALEELRRGDLRAAHRTLHGLLELRPGDSALRRRIGQVEQLIRQRDDAQARIQAEPLRYAQLYIQAGRLAEGLQLLRAALAREPNNQRLRDLALQVARRLKDQVPAREDSWPDAPVTVASGAASGPEPDATSVPDGMPSWGPPPSTVPPDAVEKARSEAEAEARGRAQAEAAERAEAARREREEAIRRGQQEAEERAQKEAEAKAEEERRRREAEERAEAERARQAEEEAEAEASRLRQEAEDRARNDEEQARREARERALREADERAQQEAEEWARRRAQARAAREAMVRGQDSDPDVADTGPMGQARPDRLQKLNFMLERVMARRRAPSPWEERRP